VGCLAFLAAGLGLAALLFSSIRMGGAASRPLANWDTLAPAFRFATLVCFSTLAVLGALGVLFSNGLHQFLLATPWRMEDHYAVADPLRRGRWGWLPWVCAAPIASTLGTPARMVLGYLHAVAVLRLAMVLLIPVAMRFRRVVMRWSWGLVAGGFLAALTALLGGRLRWLATASDQLFLPWLERPWFWLVTAGALHAAATRLEPWGRRATLRHYRREDLLLLAFGMHERKAAKPGKLLLEHVRATSGFRRWAFLLQEATGLHRARHWRELAALWLACSGVVLTVLAAAWRDSVGWDGLVWMTGCAVVAFLFVRAGYGARVAGAGGAVGPRLFPVGQLELFAVRSFFLLALFGFTGVAAAAVMLAACPPEPGAMLGILGLALANQTHAALLLLAAGAASAGASRFGRNRRLGADACARTLQITAMAALMLQLAATAIPHALTLAGAQLHDGATLLGRGLRMLPGALLGGTPAGLASPAAEVLRAMSDVPLVGGMLGYASLPVRPFDALAWTFAAALAFLSLRMAVANCRGRPHPRYGAGYSQAAIAGASEFSLKRESGREHRHDARL